jgi:hypothetical protein
VVAPENGMWSERSLEATRRYPHAVPGAEVATFLPAEDLSKGASSVLIAATAVQLG